MNPTFAADYSLSLTSSGSQEINVTANAGTVISADIINVSTTCRYGYNFTINTSVNNNNLYLNGNSSNNASGTYFTPVDGITALNASTNKWGYYYNSDASMIPTDTSVFSPVPILTNPTTVKTPLSAPASSDISDNFKIYYGVNSASNMSVGTYKMIPDTNNSNNDGTIIYTATIAEDCVSYKVHYNPTGIFEGQFITGIGTIADQTIYEGIPTNLTSDSYTEPTINGTRYYFLGWNTQQDGSGTTYQPGQSVTDLTTPGNTINLYAQWTDCPGGNICYSTNVANTNNVEGEMGNQTISNSDTSTTLSAPNFKHDGYGFASWNTKADGTGTNYGPNQTIDFTAGQYSTHGLVLYANWIASAGNIQNWTCPNNASMPIGTVTALKDVRDSNVYAVAKLADGKCWMIENLRLADKDSDGNYINLNSTYTHNPSLPLTNIYDTNQTSNHLSPTSSVAYNASTAPEGWCSSDSAACDNQSRLRTDNTVLFTNNTFQNYSVSGNVYNYGNYYNWYSATAGHGKYGSSYGSGYNAPGDICPAGWYLPKGDGTGDFHTLNTALNNGATNAAASNKLRSYPSNFVYSGFSYDGSIVRRNVGGSYFSSSAGSDSSVYYLYFDNSMVYIGSGNGNKFGGDIVRCIAGG